MVTMKDIAMESGYSLKSVSRALNGERGVSSESVLKIQEAAEKLGYVPHPLAASLKSGRSGLMAILTGPLGIPVKSAKLFALQTELEKIGRGALLSCADLANADIRESLSPLAHLADGFFLLNPPKRDELFDFLATLGKPVLIVDGQDKRFPSLVLDRERGVLEAFSNLHRSYDHFLYLNSMAGHETDGRYTGFIKSTASLGPEKISQIIPVKGNSYETGYREGIRIGQELPRSRRTLVLCTNDQMAFGFLKALYELGITVPHTAGVLGFDGDEYGAYGYTSLATIKQPVDKLGIRAVEIMEGILNGTARSREYVMQTSFLSGDSVSIN